MVAAAQPSVAVFGAALAEALLRTLVRLAVVGGLVLRRARVAAGVGVVGILLRVAVVAGVVLVGGGHGWLLEVRANLARARVDAAAPARESGVSASGRR